MRGGTPPDLAEELAQETLTESPQDSRSLLRKALNAAERGAMLIQRLLAFSRRQSLDLQAIEFEGSDSLDDPSKVQ